MKSSLLSFLSLTAFVSAEQDPRDAALPRILRENPTKRSPVVINTAYGSYNWGEFISLMDGHGHRQLQDPNSCNVDGEFFNCNVENAYTSGTNVTQIQNKIRCELDNVVGVDFQARPEVCTCSATLTEGSRVRECACSVCPYGRAQAVALDCSVVTDDPFISGPCTSLDCDGRCNGTGAAVVNQPTPSPGGEGGEAPTDDGSGVGNIGMMVGLLAGTAVSFVSVYWM